MDCEKLNRLLQLIEGTSVVEVEYGEADWRVKLTRTPHPVSGPSQPSAQPAASSFDERHADTDTSDTATSSSQRHIVTAGMTGTFYRAPSPDQPPFISVGDFVQEGQTVAVIEAMKLLNTLEADCVGRLVEFFVEDGMTVLPDTQLFAIEPSEVANV